jgi:hypothetical protein
MRANGLGRDDHKHTPVSISVSDRPFVLNKGKRRLNTAGGLRLTAFSKRMRLNFANRRLPIPILLASALKSGSNVTRMAPFASATAATSVSGDSVGIFSRNETTS